MGPSWSMVTAGDARNPGGFAALGGGTKVVAVKFVKAGPAQAKPVCRYGGGDFVPAKGGKDFADQGRAEAMGKLTIVFFKPVRMAKRTEVDELGVPALRAFRRPSLRSGLLQARRAAAVRLCSHTCPGLLAHCSPLLPPQQSIRLCSQFAFARTAAVNSPLQSIRLCSHRSSQFAR
jgi:hypothetical protein